MSVKLSNSNMYGLPDKYWQNPGLGIDDVVVIHVCDENRQVNRDFCCRRDILVKYMKYFESFLAENENGYDDIDISVHCDVEIFEWLMAYIHTPDSPPPLEKSIVVSILISSEFLQMDSLVDLCLDHIASSLSEIIRLPIDLSCISEKLINRLAILTQPKTLSQTKDRKDKVLNKLYKRRVELDFSRKALPRGGHRSIAASLTCCQFCGSVYLDSCVSSLICLSSKAAIDFRGSLVRRHQAIPSWSLTGYLKTLHAGGMSWEAIYWHVWAACEVFQGGDVMISALDTDRYVVESDGILMIPRSYNKTQLESEGDITTTATTATPSLSLSLSLSTNMNNLNSNTKQQNSFSLNIEDDISCHVRPIKLFVTPLLPATSTATSISSSTQLQSQSQPSTSFPSLSTTSTSMLLDSHQTPSLDPRRHPSVLTAEIFELICSQGKLISGAAHRALIDSTARAQIITELPPTENNNNNNNNNSNNNTLSSPAATATATATAAPLHVPVVDFYDILWGDSSGALEGGGRTAGGDEDRGRGRSESPAPTPKDGRKQTHSMSAKMRSVNTNTNTNETTTTESNNNTNSNNNNSDGEQQQQQQQQQRRSRSSSIGNRRGGNGNGSGNRGNSGSGSRDHSLSRKGKLVRRKSSRTGKDLGSGIRTDKEEEEEVEKDYSKIHEIFKSYPPDMLRLMRGIRGPIYGVWTVPMHPLQIHPNSYHESILALQDYGLIESKRLEWELDLLREYDEKRMDRFESFLISCRDSSIDSKQRRTISDKLKLPPRRKEDDRGGINGSGSGNGSGGKNEYYKDRGRQPHKY